MLREIRVSGFKSLVNFDLRVHSGMNVLVGPNGAGKTNIIRLFEFLSYLQRNTLSEAVSNAGGAGEIFRKKGSATIERQITIRIRGHGVLQDELSFTGEGEPEEKYMAYELSLVIQFSEPDNRLYYNTQYLRIKEYSQAPKQILFDTIGQWDMTMSAESESKSIKIETRKNYKLPTQFVRYMERYKAIWATDPGLQDYLITNWLQRYLPFFDKISTDISSGNSYNFVPSRVREPEDIAQPPVINSDGSGLAATLFQLKNVASGVRPHRIYGRPVYGRPAYFGSDVFAKVKAYFLLVNPNISNIDVRSDAYENKLKVFAEVKTNDGKIDMPLNFLSDGTIKWLALVTSISTSVSYFAIEEPENYIHPKMQHEFANIVRATCEEDKERFALITTHSETLLNAVLPHEMVIVSMEHGRTVAKSLLDPKLISKEISRTGFGLGYYYITEALDA